MTIQYLDFVVLFLNIFAECRCDIAVFKRTACLRLPVSTISPNSDVTEQECVNSGCCFEETNRFSFFGKVPDCFQPEARKKKKFLRLLESNLLEDIFTIMYGQTAIGNYERF